MLKHTGKSFRKNKLIIVHVSKLKKYEQHDPKVEESEDDFIRRNELPAAQVVKLTVPDLNLNINSDGTKLLERTSETEPCNNRHRITKPVCRLLEEILCSWHAIIDICCLQNTCDQDNRPASTQSDAIM